MKDSPFRRLAVVLAIAIAVAACSRGQAQKPAGETSPSASAALIYPSGIVPPADWAKEMHAGIYSSDSAKTCCFLAGSSLLTLDNPPGSQLAVFTFYVPSVKPLIERRERVSVAFNGVLAGAPVALSAGMQNVTFTIPPALRGQGHLVASISMSVKWVPKTAGVNDDQRELSVMLMRVGYI